MRKFIQNKLKEQKGLTLIELLAVIVILAIIAAIAIPAIGNIIENSRVGAIKSDALAAISAAELYYSENPDVADNVTVGNLAGTEGYIKDQGSLSNATTISKASTINGSGTVSGLTVSFSNASKKEVTALQNNKNSATNVTVTGR